MQLGDETVKKYQAEKTHQENRDWWRGVKFSMPPSLLAFIVEASTTRELLRQEASGIASRLASLVGDLGVPSPVLYRLLESMPEPVRVLWAPIFVFAVGGTLLGAHLIEKGTQKLRHKVYEAKAHKLSQKAGIHASEAVAIFAENTKTMTPKRALLEAEKELEFWG